MTKNIYILLVSLLSINSLLLSNNNKGLLNKLDKQTCKTGVLLNKGFLSNKELEPYKNDKVPVIMKPMQWNLLYRNLQSSIINQEDNPLPDISYFKAFGKHEPFGISTIPVAILNMRGDYLDDGELLKYLEGKDYSTEQLHLFAATTLIKQSNDQYVDFLVSPKLYFSNRKKDMGKLMIDFGDGVDYREITMKKQKIHVQYNGIGDKSIRVKLVTPDDTLISYSSIKIKYLNTVKPTSDLSFLFENNEKQGKKRLKSLDFPPEDGNGWYWSNGEFDKPIIIVEEFDLFNQVNAQEMFQDYPEQFSNSLLDHGYDFIAYNWTDPTQDVETSSQEVIDLINAVNQHKTGNFENIVIGESMGGIATRLALKTMENNDVDHEVGLFVSFDSPHKGANMPLGFQSAAKRIHELLGEHDDWAYRFFPWISGTFWVFSTYYEFDDNVTLQKAMDVTNSVAAKQLLLRHYTDKDGPHQMFDDLQDHLQNTGYPRNSRNIALANGSSQAEDDLGITPGELFYFNEDDGHACAYYSHNIKVRMSPVNESDYKVFWFRVWAPLCIRIINKKGEYDFDGMEWDNCPGGNWDVGSYSDDILVNQFCFLPTVSAIDLDQDEIDDHGIFQDINAANLVENDLTPFEHVYLEDFNSLHCQKIIGLLTSIKDNEIMHENLFLDNKTIHHDRDFEAENIVAGHGANNHYLEHGPVSIEAGNVNFSANNSVHLQGGFEVKPGASFSVTINAGTKKSTKSTAIDTFILPGIKYDKTGDAITLYLTSMHEKYRYHWQLTGENVEQSLEGTKGTFKNLPPGQYTANLLVSDGNNSQSISRIFGIKGNRKKKERKIPGYENHQQMFTLSPNPAGTSCKLRFKLKRGNKVSLEIMNMNGTYREMIVSGKEYMAGAHEAEINTSSLGPGVYIILFKAGNTNQTKKLIVL